MKAILPFLLLTIPATAQNPIDASNPGQRVKSRPSNVLALGSPNAASDDFNRPDSASMGPNWTEQSGNIDILNNTGNGTTGVSWMTHNVLALPHIDSVQEVDFLPQATSASVTFVACTIGGVSDCVFVKVQDNTNDGIYDRVFFYRGINGGSWGQTPYYYDLAVPTPSGRMQVTFSPDGNTVILKIDRDMDGAWDETFTSDGVLAAFPIVTPTYGISTFTDGTFDNWDVSGGALDPGSAYCFGDSTGGSCPCSAFGAPGQGCANTTGMGATMTGSGNPSVSGDTFQLDIVGVPGAKPGLILRGDSQIAVPAGDGILCTTGATQRSHVQITAAGATTFTDFNGAGFGTVANFGAVTNFQFWYRDPANTCSGAGFNFTNAWAVTYLP